MTSRCAPVYRKDFQSIALRSRSITCSGGRSFVSRLAKYAASSLCWRSDREGRNCARGKDCDSVEDELMLWLRTYTAGIGGVEAVGDKRAAGDPASTGAV